MGAIEPPISVTVMLGFFVERRKLPLVPVFLFAAVAVVVVGMVVLALFDPVSGNRIVNIFVPIVGTECDTFVMDPAF